MIAVLKQMPGPLMATIEGDGVTGEQTAQKKLPKDDIRGCLWGVQYLSQVYSTAV